jgi:hypothetical protein
LKKSSAARRKYRFVAIVGGQRDFYLAIVLQLDWSATGDFISFAKAAPAEQDDAAAIFEFGGGVDGAEGKFGPAVIADLKIDRFDEIEKVVIPKVARARVKSVWPISPTTSSGWPGSLGQLRPHNGALSLS